MPNETSLRFTRASLSFALVASVFCAGIAIDPVFAQSKTTSDGTTVQKNADGSVDAYDEGESAQSAESLDNGSAAQPGDGRIHYRPGTSPYQKKYSDGTTVKRNSDGSIETWDEGETHHYSGGLPSESTSTHRRTTRRAKGSTAKKTTTTTAKKKSK